MDFTFYLSRRNILGAGVARFACRQAQPTIALTALDDECTPAPGKGSPDWPRCASGTRRALDSRAHPIVQRQRGRWWCEQVACRLREGGLARNNRRFGAAKPRRDVATSWAETGEKHGIRRVAGRGRSRPLNRHVGSFQEGRGSESARAPIVAARRGRGGGHRTRKRPHRAKTRPRK